MLPPHPLTAPAWEANPGDVLPWSQRFISRGAWSHRGAAPAGALAVFRAATYTPGADGTTRWNLVAPPPPAMNTPAREWRDYRLGACCRPRSLRVEHSVVVTPMAAPAA